jgi:hypothetical protein
MAKQYRLHGRGQLARQGFTDVFVIKATDAEITGSTTDDLLLNIPLVTLNKGDTILDITRIQIVTAIDPAPSANAALTLSVGRTSTGYADCIAAFTIMTGGAAVAAPASSAAGASIGHQTIAADSTVVYAQLDITDTDGAISDLTAGELHIAMGIIRASEVRYIEG